jgi:nicotinamidase-related amidase
MRKNVLKLKENYKMRVLVVVDMQVDFVTGALRNEEAIKIVPNVENKIKKALEEMGTIVIFTKDTHGEDYLDTQEGKKLPIKHCIIGTPGHMINKKIMEILVDKECDNIYKSTFGTLELAEDPWLEDAENIYVCGLCTDICVISNAMILKAAFPEARIVVLKDLCAGTTPGNHAMALAAMNLCQIETVRSDEV